MYTHTFQALGTQWWVEIFDEKEVKTLEGACGALEGFAAEFETQYSRFKTDSLISTLNRERKLDQPNEECRALLNYGKTLYLRSNTHFNLLTGHILEARGYDATYSFKVKEPEMVTPGNPITDLLISADKIILLQGNVDLGGFGKGYLIDELAKLLREEFSLQYFLINGGGDMFATSNHDTPIEILLEHPTKPKEFIYKTNLLHQGFAASSPFKRSWHSGNKTYTHIVSNTEVTPVASFVKAASARDADAFATTALMLSEAQMSQIAQSESIGIACFNPVTSQLWQTTSFSNTESKNHS